MKCVKGECNCVNCSDESLQMDVVYNNYLSEVTRHNNHRVKIEEPKLMEVRPYEMH